MDPNRTTYIIQQYLDELAGVSGEAEAEHVVSALLGRSASRLHLLCATMLHRSYSRLARPPLGLQAEEMLGAVVERLLRALRQTRPRTVRGFFGLAGQHMRWELNDLARRLDEEGPPVEIHGESVVAPASNGSGLGPDARRMLDAIEALPEEEREALDLVRIHGMTHTEAAEVLGVSSKTVQRRLNRAQLILTAALGDLRPSRSLRSES
jgi:RNA polymerase sigma-70 factor (ECF subfamily)